MGKDTLKDRHLDLMALLAPAAVDELWEADKAGWRCFVMGNITPSYRSGSRLRAAWQRGYDAAWQRGYDAASRSHDPVCLML